MAKDSRLSKLSALISEANTLAQEITDEWQAEFDERSERWQESEKGQQLNDRVSLMQQVADELDSAHSTLSELLE